MTANTIQARQLLFAAQVILAGVILSGPVAVAVVEFLAPQPAWQDAATFISHYSWIQSLPYVFGFLIAVGFLFLMSVLVDVALDAHRPLARAALAFTAVSASLIFFNYTLQTAFVPLWLHRSPSAVSMVTMANPDSLGWSLEMYGYGLLGIATACAAPVFEPQGRRRLIRLFLILNCILSVIGAVLVPIIPGWVLTPWGMVAGAFWNILIAVTMIMIMVEFRQQHTTG